MNQHEAAGQDETPGAGHGNEGGGAGAYAFDHRVDRRLNHRQLVSQTETGEQVAAVGVNVQPDGRERHSFQTTRKILLAQFGIGFTDGADERQAAVTIYIGIEVDVVIYRFHREARRFGIAVYGSAILHHRAKGKVTSVHDCSRQKIVIGHDLPALVLV